MNTDVIVNSKVKLIKDCFGYYHLLLKITNRYNGKIYICKHSTKNPFDNYMGSSKYVLIDIKDYGRNAFTKEIIESVDNAEILNLYEKSVVDEEFLSKSYTYNINIGGGGNGPKYMTRRGYISELNRRQKRLERRKEQKKQVINYIENTKQNSSIEYSIHTLVHNLIQIVIKLICKVISIGISITYLIKSVTF